MLLICQHCAGEVLAAGSGYRCVCCGVTFASLEELKPKARPVRVAPPQAAAPQARAPQTAAPRTSNQSAAYVAPQSVSVPQSAEIPQAFDTPQTVAPVAVAEMEPEDIYEQNGRGVVEIITESGRASGFLISKKGLVLTNAHAVLNASGAPCSSIFVKHGEAEIPARLITIGDTDNNNPHNVDLALLAMESAPANAVALTLAGNAKVKIGQHVYYVGNSKGEGLCMTAGIVSDNCRKLGERYFIMTDASTNPGNSGGPLFNQNGEVIGVHVSARVDADGMKYAIPVSTVRVFLNTVEDQLGIARDTLADNLAPLSTQSMESISAGVVLTLVLSGISLIVKNIEFIKEIVDTVG